MPKLYFHILVVVVVVCALAAPAGAAPPEKDKEKDPDWIEFALLREGVRAGTFGFKTTAAASGQLFTSSKLDLKVKRGGLSIQTHVERDPSGRLVKYRKWVGNEGARPDLIAFWKGKKLRIVSKVKKNRFTKDVAPPEGFAILDRLGFHLYSHVAALWKRSQPEETPNVSLHNGATGTLRMKRVGTATFKHPGGNEVKAQAVSVRAEGFTLTIFVGEKPVYLGFKGKKLLMIRKGWNLLSVEEGAGEAGDDASSAEWTESEQDSAKEAGDGKEAGDKEDADGKQDLPPLPE